MLNKRVNIESVLIEEKQRNGTTDYASALYRILEKDAASRERISNNLSIEITTKTNNAFKIDLLDADKIYHLSDIKKICIDYRLRFLNSDFFKGEIPAEAIAKIKRLEEAHGIELKAYKIIAPSKLFKLDDKDDPLLFAPIGNDYYYLLHHWGGDLHPLRKIAMWPFKNIINLTLLVVTLSYLVALLVPDGLFSKNSSTAQFFIIFFFIFKCLAAIVIFYGFALGKNFNHAIWNSKYFNA
ncbi:hypothetical protein SAMN05421766_103235 [Zobellia uliginosa]|uniref:Uncharacterized protein n=1 Tax=Zobellia uliginosa TaxID=143224 RepID=A0ABY1KQW1_9FLAO|nr:hypothetical protein [Zobellia uliginosa]SIS66529.1 hypothetical protein SAMN05421766_103235 [Zobellia uliginosa]